MMEDNIEPGNILKDIDNNRYYIFQKVIYNGTNYLVCVSMNEDKGIVVLKYRMNQNKKLEICKETRKDIVNKVLIKSL